MGSGVCVLAGAGSFTRSKEITMITVGLEVVWLRLEEVELVNVLGMGVRST